MLSLIPYMPHLKRGRSRITDPHPKIPLALIQRSLQKNFPSTRLVNKDGLRRPSSQRQNTIGLVWIEFITPDALGVDLCPGRAFKSNQSAVRGPQDKLVIRRPNKIGHCIDGGDSKKN